MKKLYLLFTCLWFVVSMNMEAQIHIGEINEHKDQNYLPISGAFDYSYSQQIVYSSEYGDGDGMITQIKWKLISGASYASTFNDWTVYLGHTDKMYVNSLNDFIPTDSLTQVFSGHVNITQDGEWITIDLPTPFNYNKIANLVVAVKDNKPDSRSVYFAGYLPQESYLRNLIAYDKAPINAYNLDNLSYYASTTLAQIQFTDGINACLKPQNLYSLNNGNETVSIHWTNLNPSIIGYEYELRQFGNPGSGIDGSSSAGSISPSVGVINFNIPDNYSFVFYMRALCDSNIKSNWSRLDLNTYVPPIASANQEFCVGILPILNNIEIDGTNIKWYASETGGQALSISTLLANNTTYYASQRVNNLESTRRTAVHITLGSVTTTPVATSPQIYSNVQETLASLSVTGTNLQWYRSSTSAFPLSNNTILNNGQTYYVSQNLNGCESERVAVLVKLDPNNYPCLKWGTAEDQDFDCDGVINSIDLDDDNDGILDEDERNVSTLAT